MGILNNSLTIEQDILIRALSKIKLKKLFKFLVQIFFL